MPEVAGGKALLPQLFMEVSAERSRIHGVPHTWNLKNWTVVSHLQSQSVSAHCCWTCLAKAAFRPEFLSLSPHAVGLSFPGRTTQFAAHDGSNVPPSSYW